MPDTQHAVLTGDQLHVPGYVQATDPGAVGAGKVWYDTTGPGFKVRDGANATWAAPAWFGVVTSTASAAQSEFRGKWLPIITGGQIIVKHSAAASRDGVNYPQVGAWGHEAVGNWSTDTETAGFVQVIPRGSTTLVTSWRWEGLGQFPKYDNTVDLGTTVDDGQPGNGNGRRVKAIYAYTINAATLINTPILSSGAATNLLLQYNGATVAKLNATMLLPATTDTERLGDVGTGWQRIVVEHGAGRADGLALVQTLAATPSPRLFLVPGSGVAWAAYVDASGFLNLCSGGTFGSSSGTGRYQFSATFFQAITDNAIQLGQSGNRFSSIFGYVGNFTTSLTTAALTLTPGAFVAADKYLVVDASGHVHVSATGPAS